MNRTVLPAPIVIPHRSGVPVLLSVPHSGREYPDWLVAQSRTGLESLQSLEDPLVDRLAWRAIGAGHGAVIAVAPRAAIDCNRAPGDIDHQIVTGAGPARDTGRAGLGLGIIPGRTAAHGRLWRCAASMEDLQRRLAAAHEPYHLAIAGELDALAARHGTALLLDCHSMPPRRGQADVVIGNRHGASAAGWLADHAARVARQAGWTAALNIPYAGGYVVERHGNPASDVHALQLEIDRRSYLGADLRTPGAGFDRAAQLLLLLAQSLGQALTAAGAIAAE